MREVLTKSMARNIFYGGSLFFILIFVGLSVHSHCYIVNVSTNDAPLTDERRRAASTSGRSTPASTATRSWARAPTSRPNSAMSWPAGASQDDPRAPTRS